jgi:hypothetical protein
MVVKKREGHYLVIMSELESASVDVEEAEIDAAVRLRKPHAKMPGLKLGSR